MTKLYWLSTILATVWLLWLTHRQHLLPFCPFCAFNYYTAKFYVVWAKNKLATMEKSPQFSDEEISGFRSLVRRLEEKLTEWES